jgi:hypothetical protein
MSVRDLNNISIIYKNISIFIERPKQYTAFRKKLFLSSGETTDPKTQLSKNFNEIVYIIHVRQTKHQYTKQSTNTSNKAPMHQTKHQYTKQSTNTPNKEPKNKTKHQ